MAKRRAKEMNAELEWLRHCGERLGAFDKEGTPQLDMIEAQIMTIASDLFDAQIEERWGFKTPPEGKSTAVFDANKSEEIVKAAKDARRWTDGENDLAPSLRWLALLEDIEG